ncbi:MAG: hypothetical protein ACFCD0_14395 [Gemmataceae bacterium]
MGKKPFNLIAGMMVVGLTMVGCQQGSQKVGGRNAFSGSGTQQNWMKPTHSKQYPPPGVPTNGVSQTHSQRMSGGQLPYPAGGPSTSQNFNGPGAGGFGGTTTRGGIPRMDPSTTPVGGPPSMPVGHTATPGMPPPRAPYPTQPYSLPNPPTNNFDRTTSPQGSTSNRYGYGSVPSYSTQRTPTNYTNQYPPTR